LQGETTRCGLVLQAFLRHYFFPGSALFSGYEHLLCSPPVCGESELRKCRMASEGPQTVN